MGHPNPVPMMTLLVVVDRGSKTWGRLIFRLPLTGEKIDWLKRDEGLVSADFAFVGLAFVLLVALGLGLGTAFFALFVVRWRGGEGVPMPINESCEALRIDGFLRICGDESWGWG